MYIYMYIYMCIYIYIYIYRAARIETLRWESVRTDFRMLRPISLPRFLCYEFPGAELLGCPLLGVIAHASSVSPFLHPLATPHSRGRFTKKEWETSEVRPQAESYFEGVSLPRTKGSP